MEDRPLETLDTSNIVDVAPSAPAFRYPWWTVRSFRCRLVDTREGRSERRKR